MRKTICLSVVFALLILGMAGFEARTETTDPAPNININSGSGNVNIQFDDLSIYSKTRLVYLKNLKASEVEPLIRTRLSRFGKVQINDQENLLIVSEREPKLTDIVNLIQDLDKIGKKDFMHLDTAIIEVQFIKASQAKGIALQRMSSEGTIQADDDLNVVIITDVPSKIEQFRKIIGSLDRPFKQVVIETRIIEKVKSKNSKVGIDWVNLLNSGHIGYQYDSYPSGPPTSEFSLGVSANLGSTLNILNENGAIKIIATPKVIGVNNRLSQINTMYSEDASILLKINPIIGSSDIITLSIEASITSTLNNDSRESVNSTIVVKNNESFIIGGLIKTSKEHTIRRVPILGSVLPFLFSRKVDTDVYSELAFIITPHIVESPVTNAETLKTLEGDIK